jgi:DNA-binding NtrC family response regulator
MDAEDSVRIHTPRRLTRREGAGVIRILIVEDDFNVRLLLENILAYEGYAVTAVETAKSARMLLDSLRFDLVIADGILADGNGLDIAEEAIEHQTKALIITGNAFTLPARRLARFAVLLKPVGRGELLEAIREILGGWTVKPA